MTLPVSPVPVPDEHREQVKAIAVAIRNLVATGATDGLRIWQDPAGGPIVFSVDWAGDEYSAGTLDEFADWLPEPVRIRCSNGACGKVLDGRRGRTVPVHEGGNTVVCLGSGLPGDEVD